MGKRIRLNHNKKPVTAKGFLIDFLYRTIKTKIELKIAASTNPRITIDPSRKGSFVMVLPCSMFSQKRMGTEIRKHTLQIKTSLEKKRIRNYFMLQITKNSTGHKLL